MPPKHNPTIRRIRTRPVRNRVHRPAPLPARKLTTEDVEELRALMKKQLGGRDPRIFQLDLVQAQEERRDALCQAATGQGKTAVAAGPYVLERNAGRVTLMVSPLIGLQNEMAETFKDEFKLSAIAVNSSTKGGCSSDLVTEIVNGKYRIVLLSPEMLLSPPFVNGVLRHPDFASRVYSVIIDEAHCISHWGADFRKQYGQIGIIRVFLPRDTPIIAVSASLTERVIQDIVRTLQLDRSDYLFRNLGNDRANVSLVVRAIHNPQSSYSDLDFLIPSTIASLSDIPKIWIYADNIDVGTDIIDHLRSLLPEEYHNSIRPYNAVHDDEYRKRAMDFFREGKIRILVCTDAAGMGCNIPDIDVVVQWKLPTKLSSFVQRAGRAARNPTRQGLAVLLVEPSAYSISTSAKNTEAPEKGLKGKKSSRQPGKAKGQGFWKKATVKGYAASRGRLRGGRTCQDAITAHDEPPFERDDPSEGLYNFVQATTCRRTILGDVFNSPKANPTAPCCDICDPKLLDRTRPGIRKVSRGRGIQYAAQPCDALLEALDHWRDDVMARDEPQSLFPSSSILPDSAVEKLAKLVLPLSSGNIQNFLEPQWPLWAKYGQELTNMVLAVDTGGQGLISSPEESSTSGARQAKRTRVASEIEEMPASPLSNQDPQDINDVAPARKKARLVRSKPNEVTSFASQSAIFHVNPQPAAPTDQQQSSHSTFRTRMAASALAHEISQASSPVLVTPSLAMPAPQGIRPVPARLPFITTPTPATREHFIHPTGHNGVAPAQVLPHHLYAPHSSGSALPPPSFEPARNAERGMLFRAQPHRSYAPPHPSGPVSLPSFEPARYPYSSMSVQAQPNRLYVSHPLGSAPLPPSFEPAGNTDRGTPVQTQPHQLYARDFSGPAMPLPSFEPGIYINGGAPVEAPPPQLYVSHPTGPALSPFSFEPARNPVRSAPVQAQPQRLYTSHLLEPAATPPSFELANHATATPYMPQSYQYPDVTRGVSFAGEAGMPNTWPARRPPAFAPPVTPAHHSQLLSPDHSTSSPYPYDPYVHGFYNPYSTPQAQYPHNNTQQPN